MCKKCKPTGCRRIDKCMKRLCEFIDVNTQYEVLGSCCGHGKYAPSIIVRLVYAQGQYHNCVKELISGETIPRTRRFYKKDKRGFYFIPEVVDNQK